MAKTLRDLPIGAKVKDIGSSYYGKDIVFIKLEDNHTGCPANSTTLLTEKIISLKAFDAKEPNNSDSDRQSSGNNRYIHSNIRQWLNSSASNWYKAQHSADAPPTSSGVSYNPYSSEKGFMANLTSELRSAILPTGLKVLKNDRDGGGLESFTDKIFLLSCTEVGLSNDTSYNEGNMFDYFKSNSDRVAYPTKECVENSDYTNSGLKPDDTWRWWTRTPYFASSHPGNVRYVGNVGSQYDCNAYLGIGGVRPALNLSSQTKVSDNPDTDGAYVIKYNTPPTINIEDKDLGVVEELSFSYKADDLDDDAVSVTEKLDGRIIKRKHVALGGVNKVELKGDDWLSVPIGQNTYTIEGDDGEGGTFKVDIKFTKQVSKSTVSLKTPLPAEEMIIRSVLSVTGNIPEGAKFKVEVCNNGFDTYPTWEDVTLQVESGRKFFFSNQTTTAGKWGYNFRIEIEKGTADEPVYIRSVGGNFE